MTRRRLWIWPANRVRASDLGTIDTSTRPERRIICRGLKRSGYCAFGYREYPSLIKGGHASYQLDVSNERICSTETKVNVLVALNHHGLELNMDELKPEGVVLHVTPGCTFVLHNNANYGLTTGQASSLTPQGQPMNTSPNGVPEHTLASMDLIFSLNPTFVARGFSDDIKLMTCILKAAIQHRGFAFVEMLQACPTYNHFATHEYLLDRYFDANAEGHDPGNLQQAKTLATQFRIASPAAFSINAKTFRTSMTG
jgi:hypothetical protein